METLVKVIIVIIVIALAVTLSAVIYYGLAWLLLWAVSQFVTIEVTKKMIVATAIILWILSLVFGSKTVKSE